MSHRPSCWLLLVLLLSLAALPAPGRELGQTIEGAGSSNFDWLQQPGMKLGIAFKAPKSGTITRITLQWKTTDGYGAGSYGIYNFELFADGPRHYPSRRVIGRADRVTPRAAMDGYADGAFSIPITATLTANRIYHLVITNIDPNPRRNWSSPNGLMTRVRPWEATGCRAEVYRNGSWRPYSSVHNPWNASGSNYVSGQHHPLMITWSDGSATGDPYYSAALSAGARFSGGNRAGEFIVWNYPTATIRRIGLSVRRNGRPDGPLLYRLERVGGGILASGTLATPAQVGTRAQTWVYARLPRPVALSRGASYRLWFESPGSGRSGDYYSAPVYGELRPARWIENSWGGTRSHFIRSTGSGWSSMTYADLSFSLQ